MGTKGRDVTYGDLQKSVPVKLARLLPYITISYRFDLHSGIDSVFQKLIFRYELVDSAIAGRRICSSLNEITYAPE
jgi:hypothetical protein